MVNCEVPSTIAILRTAFPKEQGLARGWVQWEVSFVKRCTMGSGLCGGRREIVVSIMEFKFVAKRSSIASPRVNIQTLQGRRSTALQPISMGGNASNFLVILGVEGGCGGLSMR